ncbi:MAG: hypothetical protein WBP84_04925, partial [Nitrososphaeraceae archaeon]
EGLTFPNYPLDQYSESAMGQLKSVFPEFRLEHLDANASLSRYPAYKIDYSYVINTQEGPIKMGITPTYLLLEWNHQNILIMPHS